MRRGMIARTAAALLLVVFAAVCFAGYSQKTGQADKTSDVAQAAKVKYAEGEVIVIAKLPDGITLYDKPRKEAATLVRQLATELAAKAGGTASPYVSISINSGNIMTLIRNEAKTTEELLTFYKKLEGVRSAEPNYIHQKSQTDTPITVVSTCTSPNDPYYTNNYLWGLEKINAPIAWKYTNGSKDCIAVTIDSGLDYEHEDLTDNLASWTNDNAYGDYTGTAVVRVLDVEGTVEEDPIKVSGGFDISQCTTWGYVFENMGDTGNCGHGTHCTGIIGATGNNSKGVTGVCQTAGLLNISMLYLSSVSPQVVASASFTYDQIYKSFDFVVEQKAAGLNIKVVSLSFGAFWLSTTKTVEDTEEALAADQFYQALKAVADSGIIICAAAGNDGQNLDPGKSWKTGEPFSANVVPSDYCLLINKHCSSGKMFSVGNIQQNGNFNFTSNRGKQYVLIAAPGTNIYSTLPKYGISGSGYINISNTGYGSLSGTSMATPCVAGCCTLAWSLFPAKGADAIFTLFTKTATGENSDKCTYGTIDVGAAMTQAYKDWAVTLDKTKATIYQGESSTITATCAEETTISWKSSDENIATVDAMGKVTGVTCGTAEITATSSASGFVAKCVVTVTDGIIPVLNQTALLLYPGDTGTITTTAKGNITWKSSDESIAAVDANGNVTAIAVGKADITVTSESGDVATCKITVNQPYQPTLDKTELSLSQGTQQQLTATVASGKLTWSSEDVSIATVSSNGTVTAKNTGTTNIIVTSDTGHSAKCKVTVTAYTPTLDAQSVTIPVGDSRTLFAGTYDGSIVSWSCDNTAVVSLEAQGNKVTLKGLAVGTATVTATAENGNSVTCTVTVKAQASSDGGDGGDGGGGGGGGGGCNAGFGTIALLFVIPAIYRRKR